METVWKAYNLKTQSIDAEWGKTCVVVLGARNKPNHKLIPAPEGVSNEELVRVAQTRAGTTKIERADGTPVGWLALLTSNGGGRDGGVGWIVPTDSAHVVELAKVANSFISYEDALLAAPFGSAVKIIYTTGDSVYMFFLRDGVYTVAQEELPAFWEARPDAPLVEF